MKLSLSVVISHCGHEDFQIFIERAHEIVCLSILPNLFGMHEGFAIYLYTAFQLLTIKKMYIELTLIKG